MEIVQDAFYLPVDGGHCFCVWRRPRERASIRGCILHLPAFAEEMNKSRRMTALAACELARHGYGVLQIDPIGCGDSSGDFADGTFDLWIGNFLRATEWIREQGMAPELWLWALRAGALLAPPLLSRLGTKAALLLWQPVLSGRQFLTQLLRLRLAGGLLDNSPRASTDGMREQLKRGETLEIAGYPLSPQLAADLEASELELSSEQVRRIAWLEVAAGESPTLSPAARSKVDAFRSAGLRADAVVVRGPGFWQSVEIEESATLIDATAAAIAHDEP